jgi:hypothetical protein
MSTVLDRVKKLLALAASPNEHEARTAAVLAAKLIREHGLELVDRRPAARKTPSATRRATPTTEKRTRKSSGGGRTRAVADAPSRIRSPLGGDCCHCGRRYRAGTEIYWFDSRGGMHAECFDAWARTK